MPPLVRFVLFHAGQGFCIALLAIAAMIAFDVAHLGRLSESSEAGLIGVLLLVFSLGLTFAAAQVAFALLLYGGPTAEPGAEGDPDRE